MSFDICSLSSGSKGNCTLISSENTKLLIDAGIGLRELEARLRRLDVRPSEITGIFLTHEHQDHIRSAFAFAKKYPARVFAHEILWEVLEPDCKIPFAKRVVFTDSDFYVNDITVSPFAVSHDVPHCNGYSLYCQGRKISTATDLGVVTPQVEAALMGSDVVLLESNHDIDMLRKGRYSESLKRRILGNRGHLSNEAAAELVLRLAKQDTRQIILGHLSEENNLPELAFAASLQRLQQEGIKEGEDIYIDVATQNAISRYIRIER